MSDKNLGGRPTDYKPEYCQKLIEHGREGLSFDTFSAVVGVTRQTLYNWLKVHPEFERAKKEYEDVCKLWWEKAGNAMAVGKLQGNATTWIFNMKNRFGWRDKVEVDNGGKVEVTINHPDPLEAAIAECKTGEEC